MKLLGHAILCLAFLAITTAAYGDILVDAEQKKKRKAFLERIGKAFEKGDASAISDHFPANGKVQLRLRDVKNGEYRKKQATSLLAGYLKKIEPKKYELKEMKGGVGRFAMKYKVVADGKVVEGTTTVSLKKEGDTWRITGIVES